jgi:hypothetical protein
MSSPTRGGLSPQVLLTTLSKAGATKTVTIDVINQRINNAMKKGTFVFWKLFPPSSTKSSSSYLKLSGALTFLKKHPEYGPDKPRNQHLVYWLDYLVVGPLELVYSTFAAAGVQTVPAATALRTVVGHNVTSYGNMGINASVPLSEDAIYASSIDPATEEGKQFISILTSTKKRSGFQSLYTLEQYNAIFSAVIMFSYNEEIAKLEGEKAAKHVKKMEKAKAKFKDLLIDLLSKTVSGAPDTPPPQLYDVSNFNIVTLAGVRKIPTPKDITKSRFVIFTFPYGGQNYYSPFTSGTSQSDIMNFARFLVASGNSIGNDMKNDLSEAYLTALAEKRVKFSMTTYNNIMAQNAALLSTQTATAALSPVTNVGAKSPENTPGSTPTAITPQGITPTVNQKRSFPGMIPRK